MSQGDYHGARLTEDARRGAVWRALWRYFFRHRIGRDDCVLDIGAGYGDFVNAVAGLKPDVSFRGDSAPGVVPAARNVQAWQTPGEHIQQVRPKVL